MHLIYPLVFIIVSIFHVHCCYSERLKSRYITKLFLMPLLLLWYLDITSSQQTDTDVIINKRSSIIINALLFGFQGDALLIIQNKKCFLMGLFSFLMGHFLYIYAIILRIEMFEPISAFIFPLCLLSAMFVCLYVKVYMKGFKGEMIYCGLIYGQTLIVLTSLSFYLWFMYRQLGYVMLTAGATFFMLSDGILAYDKFVKQIKHGDAYVMTTYITAQTLIAIGMGI